MTINPESISVAKEGMRMAASEAGGTAYNIFKNFTQEVAGKTGSAEAGKDKNGNGNKRKRNRFKLWNGYTRTEK